MQVDPNELRDMPILKGSFEARQLVWHAACPMA